MIFLYSQKKNMDEPALLCLLVFTNLHVGKVQSVYVQGQTMNLSKRQQEIIQASLKIISESGIQGLTTKHLAKKLGISEPALYRHFKNKHELLLTILKHFRDVNKDILEKVWKNEASFKERLLSLFLKRFEYFDNNPNVVSVLFAEDVFLYDQELLNEVKAVMKNTEDFLLKEIKLAQRNNEVRKDINPLSLTILIMGTMRLLVLRWRMLGFSYSLKKHGHRTIKELLEILL